MWISFFFLFSLHFIFQRLVSVYSFFVYCFVCASSQFDNYPSSWNPVAQPDEEEEEESYRESGSVIDVVALQLAITGIS